MTIPEAKQKLVNWCNSQVGYHESWDGSNKYGADGDWDLKLYGFEASTVPWCDVFADYAYIHTFGFDSAIKMTFQDKEGSALCRRSAELYKQHGHWFSEPEIGDQIFFYYGGEINHTGIVTVVNGEEISCVEGNFADSVSRTYYKWRISSQIAGFGRPDWSVVANEQKAEDPVDTSKPVDSGSCIKLQYGDGMNIPAPEVKAWQNLLIFRGYNLDPYGADGEFGYTTQNATIQFQQASGLNANGIVEEDSWKQAIRIE